MSTPAVDSPVKVLIADDSAFMRTALSRMIESDRALQVVGTAETGLEAIEKIAALHPDVVTLDIDMPGLNGIETLKRVMTDSPCPVIMLSSLTRDGAERTIEALELGAFDYIPKRLNYNSLDIIKVQDELVSKIKAAARSRPKGRSALPRPPQSGTAVSPVPIPGAPTIIAIGTSTGGPKALQEILPALPENLPAPVLIVQHMPAGFTSPFAKRLNSLCKLPVHEAEDGMPVTPGHIYLAAAGRHMTVRRSAAAITLQLPAIPSDVLHIPSVDVMMLSVAEAFASLAMGIIMTGMGADGTLGMQAIFRKGGLTLGQDQNSCAVYGMPRSCAEMGILRRVVPLTEIPRQILYAVGYYRRN